MACDTDLAFVLSGGGARAAYQVGFLRHIAARHPDLCPGILTGVSAGGILATILASRSGSFGASVGELSEVWRNLHIPDVFRVDSLDLGSRVVRWGARLLSGGAIKVPTLRSLVDTSPLERALTGTLKPATDGTLPGIADNLARHQIEAVALTASSYSTGQSVTWVQGGGRRAVWHTPRGRSVQCQLRVNHVMASAALPLFFPAVDVDGAWYGDGGVRLTAPISPAIHLGASRIIIVSTRYPRSIDEAGRSVIAGYPPPAQVAGLLFNAIFLDLLDADVLRLQQVNRLLDRLPPDARQGLRHIDLLVLRPSKDLGRLANEFEADLPRGFRFMVRGLGSRETRSNDLLSLLMFQPDYIVRLMELGEQDANAHAKEIEALLASSSSACVAAPSSGS